MINRHGITAGAFAKCVDGKCQFDKCADGLVDTNKDIKDGCECTITNGGTEICDQIDNDCNGTADDGFDLDTDVQNCGACNTPCSDLPHASVACTAGKCEYTCEDGFSRLGRPRTHRLPGGKHRGKDVLIPSPWNGTGRECAWSRLTNVAGTT